eukprot:1246841-Prymnesium_polylepis.1
MGLKSGFSHRHGVGGRDDVSGGELLPAENIARTVSDMLQKKAVNDLNADRRSKARLPIRKYLKEHLAMTFGDSMEKARSNLYYSVRQHLASGEKQTRMLMVSDMLGMQADEGGAAPWPDAKSD